MNRRDELNRWIAEQMTAYRIQSEGECEVTKLLRRLSPEFCRWQSNHGIGGVAVHHIWTRQSRPGSYWCDLVVVSTSAHEWGHQRGEPTFKVGLAFEAACLDAKWRRQQEMVTGPQWLRETEQHRQHWDREAMDAVRRTCTGWPTLLGRCEYLATELAKTPFAGVAQTLVERATLAPRARRTNEL